MQKDSNLTLYACWYRDSGRSEDVGVLKICKTNSIKEVSKLGGDKLVVFMRKLSHKSSNLIYIMAIWVVEFSSGVYKIRKIFA